MPMRYLKPEVRDSETIDSLSDAAQVLWFRLLVTVDDYGRFDARPSMIKSACYPVSKRINEAACDKLLAELDEKGAVVVYDIAGKPFLQMLKWANTPRASKSKFPAFMDRCARVYAKAKPAPDVPGDEAPALDRFDAFWAAWPASARKGAKGKCADFWARQRLGKIADQILAHVETMKAGDDWTKQGGKYIPAPLVYLHGAKWDGAEADAASPDGQQKIWENAL